MASSDTPRHIKINDGDHTVAAAEVAVTGQGDTVARTSLHAASGHIAPGRRASLVDAVLELPEVRASARLEAAVPAGDAESIQRLRERTKDAVTRPAGSTVLLDANIPSDRRDGDAGLSRGAPDLVPGCRS
jgi:hypothetical protein